MSYANLIGVTCVDKAEVFCRYRDFVCKRNGTYDYSTTGIGWTLFDSSYAVDEDNPQLNDWFVIKGPGESGKDNIYILCTWASQYITMTGYLAWDPTTHAGSTSYRFNASNNWNVTETATGYKMWVYGDLDAIAAIFENGAGGYYGVQFGKGKVPYEGLSADISTSSSALTAGSDVVITLDSVPSAWFVGMDVFIWTTHTDNISTVKMEMKPIKAISGNDITVDLTNSYTANCRVSAFVGYFCSSSNQFFTGAYTLIINTGTGFNITLAPAYVNPGTSYVDPDDHSDAYACVDGVWSTTGGIVFLNPFPKMLAPGTLSQEDSLTGFDGTNYRYFNLYSNNYVIFKEV